MPWGSEQVGLSESGRARWAMVTNLALPVLDEVHFKLDRWDHTWRVHRLDMGGEPGVLMQKRVRADGLAPWRWVPEAALAQRAWNPSQSLPAFLDLVAGKIIALPASVQRRATPQADMAGVLSGPAWALLSGRGGARELWVSEDSG